MINLLTKMIATIVPPQQTWQYCPETCSTLILYKAPIY